jgi:hypothetical protein
MDKRGGKVKSASRSASEKPVTVADRAGGYLPARPSCGGEDGGAKRVPIRADVPLPVSLRMDFQKAAKGLVLVVPLSAAAFSFRKPTELTRARSRGKIGSSAGRQDAR